MGKHEFIRISLIFYFNSVLSHVVLVINYAPKFIFFPANADGSRHHLQDLSKVESTRLEYTEGSDQNTVISLKK